MSLSLSWCAAAVCALAGAACAQSPFPYEIIFAENDGAPGTLATFAQFDGPFIDELGGIAFDASLVRDINGVTFDNDMGIWYGVPGSIMLIAREGDALVGSSGNPVIPDAFPVLGDSGAVGFTARLSSGAPATADSGLWLFESGALTRAAFEGDIAPGSGGRAFGRFFSGSNRSAIDPAGSAVFRGELFDGQIIQDAGAWVASSGVLRSLAVEGALVPGVPGATFRSIDGVGISDTGRAGCFARIQGAGIGTSTNNGLWFEQAGALTLLAREGDVAPSAGGATFIGFNDALLAPAGDRLVINAVFDVSSPGVTVETNEALYGASDAGLELILRSGFQEPDAFDRVMTDFGQFTGAPQGQIAFEGRFTNFDEGVWVTDGTETKLIAYEDDSAPGLSGPVIDAIDVQSINSRGDVVASASLRTFGGVTFQNNLYAFVYIDALAESFPLVRTGDLFDMSEAQDGSDLRTITGFEFSEQCLNDRGEIVYRLRFTDGTEAIVRTSVDFPGIPSDNDNNGIVNLDDLYAQLEAPADVNTDDVVDQQDADALRAYLRSAELAGVLASR